MPAQPRAHVTPEGLRYRRLALGLSQAQLGELLGVRRTTIANWEGGTSTPSVGAVHDLAAVEARAVALAGAARAAVEGGHVSPLAVGQGLDELLGNIAATRAAVEGGLADMLAH